MKIFCLTFIFYLLALSWQPCEDLTTKILSSKSTPDIQAKHLCGEENNDESDDCSPFCICSCCQISTVYTNLNFSVTSASVASIEKTSGISYQNPYSYQNLDLIWQPPKFNFTV